MKEEKKFVTPNAEVVIFTADDIITVSIPESIVPEEPTNNG